MSFNANRRSKNRNLNTNYGSAPSKIDKPNRMKNINDKSQGSNRYSGVYSNKDFMYANTALIGTLVNIVHKDGQIYQGILTTFSSDYEIALEAVSKVVPKAENIVVNSNIGSLLASLAAKNDFIEKAIFNLKDIVMMSIPNVDLDFAIKKKFTDTEISNFNPALLAKEKDLVPWDGCTDDGIDDSLDNNLMLNDGVDGGWDANDMFKLHEKKYNMATTYTESMEGYTVPLDKNADDYEEREAEANRIAQLIENDVVSKDRLAKEDGDEEDKFSAVVRPNASEHNATHVNKQANYNQNNQNSINQQHSRHDNLNNNRSTRNKNNTSGNLNTSSNFSSNNSLNRSKNQSLNNSGALQQQSQPYHSFSSRSNGPLNNNRLNSRLDQQQHNHHEEKDAHHRNERLMHNDQSSAQNFPSQRSQHNNGNNNNNSNNRRLNNPPPVTMQKREETTHDLKKFSSNFKMVINQQPGNQLNDNREIVNKEPVKEVKQSNVNKSIDEKDANVNNQNKTNDQSPSSSSVSNKSLNNTKDNEDSQIVNKPANKPLLDKPPKDKSLSPSYPDKPVIATKAEQDPPATDKVPNNTNKQQQQNKSDHQTKSVESSQQSSESTVTGKQNADNEPQTQDNIKQERDTDSIKQSPETSSHASADSVKGSSSGDLQNTDKSLKKSTLNPNAKEFVFNPKANPYMPKTFVSATTYPVVNANPPPSSMPPNVNPQLAYQPNTHHMAGHPNGPVHGQPTAGNAAIPLSSQMGPVHQGGNQQLITSVIHPQQPLMAHPAGSQVHHHQMHQGAHQMLPFPTHLMSQSIQFAVQTNPQNSMHHHHPHPHQSSPYIIPAVPNQVSTANLPPNAQLTSATNAMNYGQPGGGPPNAGLVNPQQQPGSLNQAPSNGGGPRNARNKAGQYHTHNQSANTNQRSNPNNQQSNSNQPQMGGNMNQPNMQNAHVVNASGSTAVYSQQPIHLAPNFNSPPGVNPGTYQIYHHPQFQAHQHPHHTRLMSPQSLQSLGMVHHPGMTAAYATPTADPAFHQIYNNYMTNMAGVPQFIAVPPPSHTPASVSSPIHLSHHGSNTMINNIGVPVVVSTHLSTPTGQSNVQRSSSNPNSSNGSTGSQTTQQPQQLINNGAGQYTSNPMMPFIIAQPSLHGVSVEQTPPPNQ